MVLKALNPGPSPPGMLRDRCVQDDTKPRPVPLLCHSEERSDEESDIAFNLSS